MSDKMRWRYGDTNPVVAKVASETVIEIGDLLWQDVDNAKPASALAIQPETVHRCLKCGHTSKSHTDWQECPKCHERGVESFASPIAQEAFANTFLGVAMQRSPSGDTDPIRLAATGVFEFDVDPIERVHCELGDLFGPAILRTLADQRVEKVAESKYAIGRCAKRGHNLPSVLVDIRSKVMTGGV